MHLYSSHHIIEGNFKFFVLYNISEVAFLYLDYVNGLYISVGDSHILMIMFWRSLQTF